MTGSLLVEVAAWARKLVFSKKLTINPNPMRKTKIERLGKRRSIMTN
jgi:hypothetical protein